MAFSGFSGYQHDCMSYFRLSCRPDFVQQANEQEKFLIVLICSAHVDEFLLRTYAWLTLLEKTDLSIRFYLFLA